MLANGLTRESAVETISRRMEQWPLHSHCHEVVVKLISSEGWWYVGYSSPADGDAFFSYWDANIDPAGVFYLLTIFLPEHHRGQGHGAALYLAIEDIARELKCVRIQQTPSGWTHTGEDRMNYLLRRGWKPYGDEEVIKEFTHEPAC